jgi:hypothetical protein
MAVIQKLGDNHNCKHNNKGVNNMKNVKTLIIVALMGASLFASTTRTDALGGAGFWAEDYANVASFPADVNNHNVAWTSGTDFTSIFNANGTTWGFTGGTGNDVVNMMWGNGSMGAAFGLNMTPETKVADGDAADADSKMGLNIGFGMPLAGMDFGFTYAMNDNGSGDVGVNLRRAQNVWLWDTMLIDFDLGMEGDNGTADDKTDDIAGGMGLTATCYSNTSYDSGTNGLFALGFVYNAPGCVGDACVTPDPAMGINWNFAVESAMTDWATLRVGYEHGYDFASGGVAGDAFTIGLGFNYGSFNLDMALADGMMFNDPVKYMTGRNAGALGAGWTISYAW